MRTYRVVTTLAALSAVVWLDGACSRKSENATSSAIKPWQARQERISAFAHQNSCVRFDDEIHRIIGTNRVEALSLDIQRVASNNKRLVSTASFVDVIQSGEQIEAVFEISEVGVIQAGTSTCVARLECPANFIPALRGLDSEVCIAFEAAENSHTLNFTTHQYEDDDLVAVSGVVTIKGKLLAFIGLP